MALQTFSEIADTNMVHDLASSVKSLINSESKYVWKKAILAVVWIL